MPGPGERGHFPQGASVPTVAANPVAGLTFKETADPSFLIPLIYKGD